MVDYYIQSLREKNSVGTASNLLNFLPGAPFSGQMCTTP